MPNAKWVKVLIQEFEGKELVNPNQHYSKYIVVSEATPAEVYTFILSALEQKSGTQVVCKRRKRRYRHRDAKRGTCSLCGKKAESYSPYRCKDCTRAYQKRRRDKQTPPDLKPFKTDISNWKKKMKKNLGNIGLKA